MYSSVLSLLLLPFTKKTNKKKQKKILLFESHVSTCSRMWYLLSLLVHT